VFIINETRLLDFYLYLRLLNNKIIHFHYFKHLLILNYYFLGSHTLSLISFIPLISFKILKFPTHLSTIKFIIKKEEKVYGRIYTIERRYDITKEKEK